MLQWMQEETSAQINAKQCLKIANDGEPTRITQHSETVIDLTIVSPTLGPELEWKILNSLENS